jgi:predicted SprT family Zn-dependent metalloprotease
MKKYHFVCDCGQKSEQLKEYFRIPTGQKWACDDCKNDEKVRIIKDNVAKGALVKMEDF